MFYIENTPGFEPPMQVMTIICYYVFHSKNYFMFIAVIRYVKHKGNYLAASENEVNLAVYLLTL